MNLLFKLLLPLALCLIIQCGDKETIAGGDSVETGNAFGSVFNDQGEKTQGATVTLRSISFTRNNETIIREYETTTNELGQFQFTAIDTGRYVLYTQAGESSAIESKITLHKGDNLNIELHLRNKFSMSGTVITSDGTPEPDILALIPGTGISALTSSNGAFTFKGSPTGHYDITFIRNSTLHYLPVKVQPEKATEVSLGLMRLTATPDETPEPYSFYLHEAEAAYAINPETQISEADIEGIEYYSVAGNDTAATVTPLSKPLWKFSLITGVSRNSITKYGDRNTLLDSISAHLRKIEDLFNDPGVFDGHIQFSIDSTYEFSDITQQKTAPPAGYDIRCAIESYQGDEINVITDLNYYRSTNDGDPIEYHPDQKYLTLPTAFTDENAIVFAKIFSRVLGMEPLDNLSLHADSNHVNGREYVFNPDQTSEFTWHPWHVHLMNYFEGGFIDKSVIYPLAFPDSVVVQVYTDTDKPVEGASVKLYPFQIGDFHLGKPWIADSLFTEGLSNPEGQYSLTENPYLNDTGDSYKTWNIMFEASEQSIAHTFVPVIDLSLAWFANPDTVYTIEVLFK